MKLLGIALARGVPRGDLARSLCPSAIAAALAVTVAVSAHAQTRKPRVPIGIDPGGVMIAIAGGTGIDYTQKDIATRLARDGEGELIGWDFVDNDRQPYAPSAPTSATTQLARTMLVEAPASRLAVFRTKPGDKIALGRLAVYAAQSRSRILVLTSSSSDRADWEAFAEAVTHFKELLVIVPTEPGPASFPAALGLANVLSVTAAPKSESPAALAAFQPDLAVSSGSADSHATAARAAALAARISISEPGLDGPGLKQRILSVVRSAGLTAPPQSPPAPSPLSLPRPASR